MRLIFDVSRSCTSPPKPHHKKVAMSFVSSRELEAARELRKEQKRASREHILQEARESFERAKKREELKRERGEDKWMAPGISKRLGLGGEHREETSPDRKKKKSKKEHKKHKKHKTKTSKHRRKKDEDASSSASSDSETEVMWVEKTAEKEPESPEAPHETPEAPHDDGDGGRGTLKREDWMMMALGPSARSMAVLTGRRETQETKEEEEKKRNLQCFDKPGQHPRELNPFWKEGGKGLPPHQPTSEVSSTPREDRPKTSGSSVGRVGDGGRSWMLRSYKRAVEQAETEGRSLEEIAAERWGSLEKLHSLLRAAGVDPREPDRRPRGGKREYLYSRSSRVDSERISSHGRSRDGERSGKSHDWRREDDKSDSRRSKSGGFLKPGESDSKFPSGNLEANRFSGGPSKVAAAATSQSWRKKRELTREDTPPSDPTDSNRSVQDKPGQDKPRQNSPDFVESSTSSGQERQQDQVTVPAEPITDTQLNAIGAKLMKAEMMGNAGKIEKLKKELEHFRKMKKLQEEGGKVSSESQPQPRKESHHEEKTIVLTKTDRFGRTMPVEHPSCSRNRAVPSRTPTHSKKGKRQKYFADDDQYSLKNLIEQERMTTAEETHAAIARMAAKFIPASSAEETVDDALDSKAALKYDPAKEEERHRQSTILESRRMAEILENCKFCFGNPSFDKQLLVAIGINTYLAVPAHQSLTEGHCLILPMEHESCSLSLDENIWGEIRVFQKGLTHMFAAHDMDAVFMETYTSTRRKSHMYVECIPLPREEGSLAPMYFKKAILESDEEWSQNKKLVDTRQKGVRNSIPAGLPYFFVDFGLDGGYAHVIEDQSKFPHYFGREVLGGMLDVEPRLWLKPPRDSFETQKEKVLRLSEWWKPYDWTQKLEK